MNVRVHVWENVSWLRVMIKLANKAHFAIATPQSIYDKIHATHQGWLLSSKTADCLITSPLLGFFCSALSFTYRHTEISISGHGFNPVSPV